MRGMGEGEGTNAGEGAVAESISGAIASAEFRTDRM